MEPIAFFFALLGGTVVIGILAVLGGVGGGVIFTPIMMGFTDIDSYIIRATGLLVAMAGALVAARPFLRRGLANMKLLLLAGVPYSVFAVVGALLAGFVKDTAGETGEAWIRLALGVLVVGVAVMMVLGGRRVEYPVPKKVGGISGRLGLGTTYWEESLGKPVTYQLTTVPGGVALFCGTGLVSGLFGVGAGWAMVPVLNLAMLAPLKVAAASSKVLIGIGDTAAVWQYVSGGGIFPLFAVPCVIGLTVGTIIGSRIMLRADARYVRWVVVVVMLGSGIRLVIDGLARLGVV